MQCGDANMQQYLPPLACHGIQARVVAPLILVMALKIDSAVESADDLSNCLLHCYM